MNRSIVALNSILRKSLYLRPQVELGVISGTRCIHDWVRPMILSLRKRRIMHEKKFPVPKPPEHRNTFLEWNYNAELFAFCKRLSEEIDDSLLRKALTDKSYVVMEQKRQEEVGLNTEALISAHNEFMAEEGRTVLQRQLNAILTAEFPAFPEEGIGAVTDYLISEPVLSSIASQIGLKDLIQCVEIPPSPETFARSFAALISAIEKTSGDDHIKTFIEDFVVTHLADKNVNEIWNVSKPWQMLSDIQKSRGETFEARLLREAGKNTLLSVFVVGLYNAEKKQIATGIGETVEIAQEMAARDALSRIFGTQYPRTFKFIAERVKRAQRLSEISDKKEAPHLKATN